ncbi:MAG: tryptophan-rich sensory protein [Bacteroidaceae bacterium]|nr:tryptophan-rich sensory protein [Bacteroidaceae bacterium]
MKKVVPVIMFVALCLFAGYVSRVLQASSLDLWYPALLKSPLTPPDAAFPIVWSLLYVLMGVAAGIMWGVRSIYSRLLFTLFSLQLVLNVLWSFSFFYMMSPLMGLVVILVMDMLALIYVAGCFVVNKVAGWLMVPYMLWLLFATYLNGFIAVYN